MSAVFSFFPMPNMLTNGCTKMHTKLADDRDENARRCIRLWTEGNRSKCEKHGVSVATIEALFRGELMVLPDPATPNRKSASKRSAEQIKAAPSFSHSESGATDL